MAQRIGIIISDEWSSKEAIKSAKLADRKGLHSVWVAEDYYFRESVSRITSLAVATKDVKLGIGVLPAYTRTPALAAMAAATIDEISNKRFMLGVGASLAYWAEQQGLKYEKNLSRVRDYVTIIRQILTGGECTYHGKVLKSERIQLGFKPLRSGVPIYLAGMRPKMLELAGEIGDGVLLSVATPIGWMPFVKEHLKIGSESSGKKMDDLDIASYVYVSVSEESEIAREKVKKQIAFELNFAVFDQILSDVGMLEAIRPMREAYSRVGIGEAMKLITDDIIDNFAIAGTPEECKKKLGQFIDAGLKLPIVWPVWPNTSAVIEALL